MKKYKSMIVLLSVLAVFVVIYVILKAMPEDTGEEKQADMVTEVTDVTAMTYTNGESEMSFEKKEDAWYLTSDETFKLNQDAVSEMAGDIGSVEAIRKITKPDALEDYGLAKPQYTVTLTGADGEQVMLYIGDTAGSDYYATTGEKEVVYTISSTVVDAMEFDKTALEAGAEEEEAPSATE